MSENKQRGPQRRQVSRKESAIRMVNVVSCANIAEVESLASDQLLVDENELNAMHVFQQSESSRSLSDGSSQEQLRQEGQGHQLSKKREGEETKSLDIDRSLSGASFEEDKKNKEQINSEVLRSDDEILRRPSSFLNECVEDKKDKDKLDDQQMKENQVDKKQLIDLLRNQDNPFISAEERQQLKSKQIDDMKSHYTLQSIGSSSSFNYLMLLLQNFSRSQNSEIIEVALSKIQEKFANIETQVKNLIKENEKLVNNDNQRCSKIATLETDLEQSKFENERLKKALHTKLNQLNSEFKQKRSNCGDNSVGVDYISQKELAERKKSMQSFKRINTMGHFEMQKQSLDNSFEKLEPKEKKKKANKIPLPLAKPKENKTNIEIQRMNSLKTQTLGKVRENSLPIDSIDENFIRASREGSNNNKSRDVAVMKQASSVINDKRIGMGPKISNLNMISSKRNHCYRPMQSQAKIEDSKYYQNSYFQKTDGAIVDSTLNLSNRIPVNFNLTKQVQEPDDEDVQMMFGMNSNNRIQYSNNN